LRADLGIPEVSWFWRELVLSQVRYVISLGDDEYKFFIPSIVDLIRPHPLIQNDALVLLLDRHSQGLAKEPSDDLKKMAILAWGSPNLHVQAKWGLVKRVTKRMVQEWLVREDLRDFFELLQKDGTADKSRLNFWIRYAGSIDFSYFLFGPHINKNKKPSYVQLRNDKFGRFSPMYECSDSNNAFVLKIGDIIFVEFGEKNNACYCYEKSKIPFEFDGGAISEKIAKNKNSSFERIYHYKGWEEKFSEKLEGWGIMPDAEAFPTRKRGTVPVGAISPAHGKASQLMGRFSKSALIQECTRNKLLVIDNSKSGGAIWVKGQPVTSEFARQLQLWGFSYSPGKGFWKK